MVYKIFAKISAAVSIVTIWEIVLGFNGDLLTAGSLKLRSILALLSSFFGLVLLLSVKKKKPLKSDLLFYASASLLFLIGFTWTSIGIVVFNNKYAMQDGQGLVASISFLGIYFSLSTQKLSSRDLNLIFQLPMIILFSSISLLWLLQSFANFDSQVALNFIMQYSKITFTGGENELGRLFFLNTVLLPLSAFIFSLQVKKISNLRFWSELSLYCVTNLSLGSRGISISCIAILTPAILFKFKAMISKYGLVKAACIFSIPILLFLSVLVYGSGGTLIEGSRFFDQKSGSIFADSDTVRYLQFYPLLEGFMSSPIIGNGFGYFTEKVIRSAENPFSYELFFVALLAKIGLIGFIIYVFSLLLLYVASKMQSDRISNYSTILSSLSLMTTIFLASTNPFLDKQIGLLLLYGPYIYLSLTSNHTYRIEKANW